MKNITGTAILTAIIMCGSLYSQPKQGASEFSLSGNLGSTSSSRETSGSFGSSKSESEAQGFLTLALRPGFFVTDGLEIEPEILWTAMENLPPVFSLSGNLAYNFSLPESRIIPFVLLGYGTGNGIPIFQRLLFRSSDKMDIGVLNAGAGLKYFVTERIAFRTEYRYQTYSQETTSGSGSFTSTQKTTQRFHNIFLGFSIMLP